MLILLLHSPPPPNFEKFRHASKLTTKLASLASDESRQGFEKRMSLLKELVSVWENDKNLTLVEGKFKAASFDIF